MKIFYILLGYLVNYLNSQCDELKIQSFVNCYQFRSRCYILEGDKEHYQELQHEYTQIVEKVFQYSLISRANFNKNHQFFDCIQITRKVDVLLVSQFYLLYYLNKLFLSVNYNKKKYITNITCMKDLIINYYINFDLIFYEEQTNYSELIRIDTTILANEVCDEMFTNEDGTLSLFCICQFTLKQYSLDSLMNVILTLEHDVSEQIKNGCNKKVMIWKENQYIIVFYQCSNWKVLLIKNNQITLSQKLK